MSASTKSLFRIDVGADSPRIIGTSWWNDAVKDFPVLNVNRRQLLNAGGALLGVVLVGKACVSIFSDNTTFEERNALDMQRAYGWGFGAPEDAGLVKLTIMTPADRAALLHLASDLKPKRPDLAPYAIQTLFDSVVTPPSRRAGEEPQTQELANVLGMLPKTSLEAEESAGRLAADLAKDVPGAAMIVDLPGTQAVAFAAGAARLFDPVFLFDNWPHPRGVVRSHLTLAAAASYQRDFVERARDRSILAPPMFVLDRDRLSPYSDDASQFDNRYVAKLPTRAALQALGIKHLVYVTTTLPESDDLNDDFSWWVAGGIAVHAMRLAELLFAAPGQPPGPNYAQTTGETARSLFLHRHGIVPADASILPPSSATWQPVYAVKPRATPFSQSQVIWEPTPQVPPGFGKAIVVVEKGRVLGGRMWRNGSWNRAPSSSSSWGGG